MCNAMVILKSLKSVKCVISGNYKDGNDYPGCFKEDVTIILARFKSSVDTSRLDFIDEFRF